MIRTPEFLGLHPDFPGCKVMSDPNGEFCHTQPYPSDEQLASYYQSEYREVRNESPDEAYIAFMDRRAAIQRDFITTSSGLSNFKTALDIGCGAGRLVNALAPICKSVLGYEGDRAMAAHASTHAVGDHIQIINRLFLPEVENTSAHLVTMSHVLEHVPHPSNFLRQVAENIMDPGGFFFIEVPNDPEHWVRKQISWKIRGLAHLNFFTEASLKATVEESGLKVLALRSCGQTLEQFIQHRKPKTFALRQWLKVKTALLPDPPVDVYHTAPGQGENIYLQIIAVKA